jgi:MFS transporter, CP family, cyanate transporter
MTWTKSLRVVDPAYVVILAGVGAALHVGKLSPALPVLQADLGVSLLQAGFLLSLVQFAGMVLGLAVGLAADGLGLKRSMLGGLLVLSLASGLGGWAQDVDALLMLRTLEGFGFLLVITPAPSLIRSLVPSQRMSVMLGLWGAYMPLGAAIALLCGPSLISMFGWQLWWWLLGGLTLLMAALLWQVVPGDAANGSIPVTPAAIATEIWQRRLRQTLSARGPWLVAFSFSVYSAQWLAVIGFLPMIYAQGGMTGGITALLTALVAAVNIIGNIVSGRLLAHGLSPQRILYAGFAAMALGASVAFASVPAAMDDWVWLPDLRFAAVLLFSMVGGMVPGTLFSLAVELAPNERTVSTTVGWMQQWSALGQFAGPPAVAWVAGATGGWHWIWVVTAGCALGGGLLARQISRLMARAGVESRSLTVEFKKMQSRQEDP